MRATSSSKSTSIQKQNKCIYLVQNAKKSKQPFILYIDNFTIDYYWVQINNKSNEIRMWDLISDPINTLPIKYMSKRELELTYSVYEETYPGESIVINNYVCEQLRFQKNVICQDMINIFKNHFDKDTFLNYTSLCKKTRKSNELKIVEHCTISDTNNFNNNIWGSFDHLIKNNLFETLLFPHLGFLGIMKLFALSSKTHSYMKLMRSLPNIPIQISMTNWNYSVIKPKYIPSIDPVVVYIPALPKETKTTHVHKKSSQNRQQLINFDLIEETVYGESVTFNEKQYFKKTIVTKTETNKTYYCLPKSKYKRHYSSYDF